MFKKVFYQAQNRTFVSQKIDGRPYFTAKIPISKKESINLWLL